MILAMLQHVYDFGDAHTIWEAFRAWLNTEPVPGRGMPRPYNTSVNLLGRNTPYLTTQQHATDSIANGTQSQYDVSDCVGSTGWGNDVTCVGERLLEAAVRGGLAAGLNVGEALEPSAGGVRTGANSRFAWMKGATVGASPATPKYHWTHIVGALHGAPEKPLRHIVGAKPCFAREWKPGRKAGRSMASPLHEIAGRYPACSRTDTRKGRRAILYAAKSGRGMPRPCNTAADRFGRSTPHYTTQQHVIGSIANETQSQYNNSDCIGSTRWGKGRSRVGEWVLDVVARGGRAGSRYWAALVARQGVVV